MQFKLDGDIISLILSNKTDYYGYRGHWRTVTINRFDNTEE